MNINNFMIDKFAPAANKVIANAWVGSVADAFMKATPFILTGSVVYVYNVIVSWVPSLPDLSMITNFSFGLLALFLAFLIPYNVMERKGYERIQVPAGLAGMAFYMMTLHPEFNTETGTMNINSNYIGPAGSLVVIVIGLVVGLVFYLVERLNIMKESTNIPDFLSDWLNIIIPVFILLAIGMVVVYNLNVDITGIISSIFLPFTRLGQSYIGMLLLCLMPAILAIFGVSGWCFTAVSYPIFLAGIAENAEAVANGLAATNIVTNETVFTLSIITMGGVGCTLPLVILSCFLAKSKRVKIMGRVTVLPSLFNINEPVIYGYPIAYNPTLSFPYLLNTVVGVTIVYAAMRLGLMNIPSDVLQVGQIPGPVACVLVTRDIRALFWWILCFVIYTFIWLPYFRKFDRQCMAEEEKEQGLQKETEG